MDNSSNNYQQDTSSGSMLSNLLKKRWVMLLLVAIGLLVLFVLYNYSFLEVHIEQPGGAAYQITNQKSGKINKIRSSNSTIKRLVPRGSYEVYVSGNQGSSFAVVETNGFLRKSTVKASLKPQKKRQFIGNNPSGCSYILGDVLYSYSCSGGTSKTQHVPATNTQPTYATPATKDVFGDIFGIITTKEGVVALYDVTDTKDASIPTLYVLRSGVRLEDGIALTQLNNLEQYKIKPYKEGFVVYNEALTDVYYYSSVSAKPEKLNVTAPSNDKLKPLSLETAGDILLISYADKIDFQNYEDSKNVVGDVKTELHVYKDGKARVFNLEQELKNSYTSIKPCGTDKICAVYDDQLSVFDISGEKIKYSYKVDNVTSTQAFNKTTLVVRKNDVLNLDVDQGVGFVDFSLGEYTYCGLSTGLSEYTLCMYSGTDKVVALKIDQTQPDQDNIDKKVNGLLDTDGVTGVSIYGYSIFVTADFGPLVYSNSAQSFVYNPVTKEKITNDVISRAQSLGINTSTYSIKVLGTAN